MTLSEAQEKTLNTIDRMLKNPDQEWTKDLLSQTIEALNGLEPNGADVTDLKLMAEKLTTRFS